MPPTLSPRLKAIIDALPLAPGMRVLEIGCGPGAAAREVVRRLGETGHVLAIDRSPKAIARARQACAQELASGRLTLRQIAIEDLEPDPADPPFDLAFAIRVGALDGRHPEAGRRARERVAALLKQDGQLFIDGGEAVMEVGPELWLAP